MSNLELNLNDFEKTPDYTNYNLNHNNITNMKPNSDPMEKTSKQPVNIVAPLKVEGRQQSQPANLEQELAKLHEMLQSQEKQNEQRLLAGEQEMEHRMKQLNLLQTRMSQAETNEKALERKIAVQEHSQAQLKTVMQDYEMLIGKLTAEVETQKELRYKLEKMESDKEAALSHLNNVESAFSDVHSKYEKCKKSVEAYKKNESILTAKLAELRELIRIKERTLENLQRHAGSEIEAAQREMERIKLDHEQELTRLKAMLRKTEIKAMSLQEAVDQKVKENQELTTICDDLIAGKGYAAHR